MHFIQNNWFAANWILFLLFIVACLLVVFYIQHRKQLFRYSAIVFFALFVSYFIFFFIPQIQYGLSLQNSILPKMDSDKASEEDLSTLAKFIDFIWSIIKHKLT